MTITITAEQPDTEDARALIAELDDYGRIYPPESDHGYSVEKLLVEGVAFFVTRVNGEPAGCGGVQFFGFEYGEIKRMFVRPAYRRMGLGKRMLDHLAEYARQQGVGLLRLETGIYSTEAIGLYERMGFSRIPRFGTYPDDPLSVYFEKRITP